MEKQQDLVAFNPADGASLTRMLMMAGADGVATPAQRQLSILFAKTSTSIPAGGSGQATYRAPTATGWTDTTAAYTVYNEGETEIAVGKKVVLFPIDGRWAAFEVC